MFFKVSIASINFLIIIGIFRENLFINISIILNKLARRIEWRRFLEISLDYYYIIGLLSKVWNIITIYFSVARSKIGSSVKDFKRFTK